MRRYARLSRLQSSTTRKLDRFAQGAMHLATSRPTALPAEIESSATALTIDLLNYWQNVARAYFVSCSLGALTVTGTPVWSRSFVATESVAVAVAIRAAGLRRQPRQDGTWHRRSEPTWASPDVLVSSAWSAHLTNASVIESAFQGGFDVFGDLPVFRNYFAHRNRETRAAAMQLAPKYGVGANEKPSSVLSQVPVGGGPSVLETWIGDIRTTVEYLCH